MSAPTPALNAAALPDLARIEKGAHIVVWWALELPPGTAEFVRKTPANTARELLGYEDNDLFSIASVLFSLNIQVANEANQKRPAQGITPLEIDIGSASALFESPEQKPLAIYSLNKALRAHIRKKTDKRETLRLP